jgi:hypothetical protein
MSKKVKPGVDVRAPNPTKTKRMGRSSGTMVFNEHVGRMVTPKMDKAINNNRQKK